ncbi:hypothetical protein MUP95_02895, partial [bacterium]|nr:hypothetical protein [bacterium]
MSSVRIYLNKKLNAHYFSIMEEYNSLMDRWNSINNKIHAFEVPTIFLLNTKSQLIEIGKSLNILQKEYIQWNKKATIFLLNPSFKFDDNQQAKELTYTHFSDMLQHTINFLDSHMKLIGTNYNNKYSTYRHQININIAISAFLISLIGLVLSLIQMNQYHFFNLPLELNMTEIFNQVLKLLNSGVISAFIGAFSAFLFFHISDKIRRKREYNNLHKKAILSLQLDLDEQRRMINDNIQIKQVFEKMRVDAENNITNMTPDRLKN